VPGGSGGGVPGKGGWTGLGFVRFFAGRGLAKSQLNRAPSRVQHHAHQNAVDAEPGMPEAGVVHAPSAFFSSDGYSCPYCWNNALMSFSTSIASGSRSGGSHANWGTRSRHSPHESSLGPLAAAEASGSAVVCPPSWTVRPRELPCGDTPPPLPCNSSSVRPPRQTVETVRRPACGTSALARRHA
jgi:hypothetical protein